MDKRGYICWILPSGRTVSTAHDHLSELQAQGNAELLEKVIFFFAEEDIAKENPR